MRKKRGRRDVHVTPGLSWMLDDAATDSWARFACCDQTAEFPQWLGRPSEANTSLSDIDLGTLDRTTVDQLDTIPRASQVSAAAIKREVSRPDDGACRRQPRQSDCRAAPAAW